MGGKGSGSSPDRTQFSSPATGQDSFAGQQRPQQQQRSYSVHQQRAQQQSRPRQQPDLRIGAEKITNLYAPQKKPAPMAPLPARVGVRQERQQVPNPALKFSEREISNLYAGSQYDPKLQFSEAELDSLFGTGGGTGGSLLSDDEGFGGYGAGL